jgi:hypothetical protein
VDAEKRVQISYKTLLICFFIANATVIIIIIRIKIRIRIRIFIFIT